MARKFPQVLTTQQWYDKIRSWVPRWYFLEENYNDAHMWALATIMNERDNQIFQHMSETFIEEGADLQLDEHGSERSIPRIDGELDAQYRVRLRNLNNKSSCPSLKELVDQVLFAGEASIIPDYKAPVFLNREEFYNRGAILVDQIVNVFTILLDKQVHEPYSFYGREYFMNREDFIGQQESSNYVFELIQAIIDQEKAEGTLYRVIERFA